MIQAYKKNPLIIVVFFFWSIPECNIAPLVHSKE